MAPRRVEEPHQTPGYSRAKFPHWAKVYGQCDTREVVLARDGKGVTQDSLCRAVAGTWYSPYDGKTLDAASKVDVDHLVPISNAWKSGADLWTTDKRKAFANDLTHSQLIAVSAIQPIQRRPVPGPVGTAEQGLLVHLRACLDRHQVRVRAEHHGTGEGGTQNDAQHLRLRTLAGKTADILNPASTTEDGFRHVRVRLPLTQDPATATPSSSP
ncbi:hypothetical protein Scel_29020 [Streptomyces cellostaticus]|nr:hypothetical protein Scel_29020 [Streptomyces cellostaticus]